MWCTVLKQEHARNKIDRTSLILSIVAILAIAFVGSYLLRIEMKNQSVIIQPETDVIYEQSVPKEQIKININTATKEELMLLDGIGDNKADNIISYRQQKPFTSINDITNVSGIGEKIYEEIADKICTE